MNHRSIEGRSVCAVVCIAALVTTSVLGCAADPISPSKVARLRILGLSPTPAEPSPGDTVSLELLWTDPPPSCIGDLECPLGQTCESGQCERVDDRVQLVWLVSNLAAWQSTGSTSDNGGFGGLLGSSLEIPGLGECELEEETCSLSCDGVGDIDVWDLCTMACQGMEGSDIFLCCGEGSASRFDLTVPDDIEVPPPVCSGETSIDNSQVLQVQAQVCVGGRINLCDLNASSLSFGCEGEGAETVVALSRVNIAHDPEEANLAPTIDVPIWGRWQSTEIVGWDEETIVEVEGCLDSKCSSRSCSQQSDCEDTGTAEQPRGEMSCDDGLCREEFSIALSSEAQETYLRPCDEEASCTLDDDCASSFVCDDGSCRRVENPVTAYYATDGLFTPGRMVLDTTGDGRPDLSRFRTRWLPPVLEECETDEDCYLGDCFTDAGRCSLEVPLWVVARDGRGGQVWLERLITVVPPSP